MAHIQDRGTEVERRWQAHYRAPDGAERLPTVKMTELRAIRPSMIQARLRGRQQELAPRTVRPGVGAAPV